MRRLTRTLKQRSRGIRTNLFMTHHRKGIDMASNTTHAGYFLPLAILAGLVSAGHTAPAQAQTAYPDPTGYSQCAASDINDSNNAVGTCVPAGVGGQASAVYAAAAGNTFTPLQPLVTGQACSATGVADDGIIVGGCVNTNNIPFGVAWTSPTAAPVQLQPLSLLQIQVTLLQIDVTLGDVSTVATGYNQNGVVVGESISSSGESTPVLYANGSGTPIPIAGYATNCYAVDINQTTVNGEPSVALDCPTNPSPSNSGPTYGAIAQYTALLGGYVVTALPLPSGATHCTVTGINDNLEAVGTCHFPAPDLPRTAVWATPTSVPTLLTVSGSARNAGRFINSSGNVVFEYQNSSGKDNAGFWNTSTNAVTLIPPLTGGTHAVAKGLGDNNKVTLTSETTNEQPEAAEWTSSGGTVALGDLNSGKKSGVAGTNKSGTAAVIDGEGSTENDVGGEAGL